MLEIREPVVNKLVPVGAQSSGAGGARAGAQGRLGVAGAQAAWLHLLAPAASLRWCCTTWHRCAPPACSLNVIP